MSSKGQSDAEARILERQRQVAAALASKTTLGGSFESTTDSGSNTKIAPSSSGGKDDVIDLTKSQMKGSLGIHGGTTLQKQLQRDKVKKALEKKAPPPTQKRPTATKRPPLRNKGIASASRPTTSVAAAVAKAKTRVQQAKVIEDKKLKATSTTTSRPAGGTSKLAQLVSASAQTSVSSSTAPTSEYDTVEPDDFWKNIRDWDFLRHLYQEKNNLTPPPKPTTTTTNAKPLPDRFVSHRHYCSVWAPLCLTEARAQLLSEVMQEMNYWHKPGKGVFDVKVRAIRGDAGSSVQTSINVRVDAIRSKNSDQAPKKNPSFFPNDVVALITSKRLLDEALLPPAPASTEGNVEYSPPHMLFRKCCLVGHTEQSRRAIDGLVLKVSKKWWAQCGAEDMVLLKIGSNVTALREFTALSRVSGIPLRNYLLATNQTYTPIDKRVHKEKLVLQLGDVGKGFAKYAKHKFNTSQLAAISASAREYGAGGFTLIKGPPGTGKTTTLVALLNSLHIRQFNKYYEEVKRIATSPQVGNRKSALGLAQKSKPRLLVCAPSNAAVDNIILKIMSDGFVDGNGQRYNPSMVRVGVGQSVAVKDVALEQKVDVLLESSNMNDIAKLEASIAGYRMEIQRVQTDIFKLRLRVDAIAKSSPWPLSKNWEIRIDEDTFDETGRVYFVNHKDKTTSFETPPPPEPNEKQYPPRAMPEYRAYLSKIVKLVERYNSITSKMERCDIVLRATRASGGIMMGSGGGGGYQNASAFAMRQQLETHILDSVHIVMTTLGTAGNRVLESAAKFEVVVVDEAAQSVEPATLVALQLGSSHAILVGDPQQLPATIFSVSGRNTKYDRSLFQRLEEAGHPVHLLNTQYRMHPAISDFPRRIFYGGELLDGPNVKHPEYGNPLRRTVLTKLPSFQPLLVLDLDSKEERGGTSLANSAEAYLAVHVFASLRRLTKGMSAKASSRVAVITPYAQQKNVLQRCFSEHLGSEYESLLEVNTVDAFQGREASIVIFSCVRAAGSRGIGFLSDVRRMNVALTRAKHFLFVIARCQSIIVNPYWRDLVHHAQETNAVVKVHMNHHNNHKRHPSSGFGGSGGPNQPSFTELELLKPPDKKLALAPSSNAATSNRKRGREGE